MARKEPVEGNSVVAWALALVGDGPVADYPCSLAKDQDCPASSGVALVEALIRARAALARHGIHWELHQLPSWSEGNRLAYVNVVMWRSGQEPPRVGWPLAPGRWVRSYRLWLARTRGWRRQYTAWQRRVAAARRS